MAIATRQLAVLMLLLLGLTSAAWAQTVPPALMVQEGDKAVPMKLSRLAAEVRILGHLTETKMTMTFSNPHDRALAGDLYFPLPEGSTVSGYALDINGVMVDGVVVEKDRGRQVFESVVRQGIDPGLIEWVKGNNFKTRVFPIPARGSRTIRVEYVGELTGERGQESYRLPLKFKDNLAEVSLRVDVVRAAAAPTVKQGGQQLGDLKFLPLADGFTAQAQLKDAALAEDLVLALPAVENQQVAVEKGPDGEFYFCVSFFPAAPQAAAQPAQPKSITLLWDASGSREKADHPREFKVLRDYFARLKGAVTVDVVLFRDRLGEPKRYEVVDGDIAGLLADLEQVAYDGGTQMAAISPPPGAQPDLYLLFTDGISNFGKEEPAGFKRPVYIFAADASANHPFLRYLAMQTGGVYFNLLKLDTAAVLAGMAGQPFSFLSADFDKAQAAGVYPRLSQPVQGRFTLVGRLIGDEAKLAINFGAAGSGGQPGSGTQPGVKVEQTVSRAGAAQGNLLRRFWAQQKVAELMIFPERNEEDIVATGKLYGLVTPSTSLIVLDRLEQYLEHQIPPPATLPEMRRQYDAQVAAGKVNKDKEEKEKLDHVLALWNERVKWWETEFKYPKDFKYQEAVAKGQGGGVGRAGAVAGRPLADQSGAATDAEGTVAAPHRSAPTAEAPPATGGRPSPAIAAPSPAEPSAAPAAPPPGGPQTGAMFGRGEYRAKAGKDDAGPGQPSAEAAVVLKAWDPKTPYLEKLKAAKPNEMFAVYMTQRKQFGKSPAFFLDCANYLFTQKQAALAVQVLSNIAELELENAALLRILAYKLAEEDMFDLAIVTFEQVRKLRPEEPQSHRDLALVLARRAGRDKSASDYQRAIELLNHVVMNKWDRFDEIELIALMELNDILPRAKAAGLTDIAVDPRLVKLLDLDIRIALTWDADLTDIDLHVVEPSGERAFYSHNRTTIGGAVSKDFTQGYGPEEYLLRRAMHGMYKVQANFYGSSAQTLQGAVTLQVDIFTNYGRPNEKRKSITLRLSEKKETIDVGEMEF